MKLPLNFLRAAWSLGFAVHLCLFPAALRAQSSPAPDATPAAAATASAAPAEQAAVKEGANFQTDKPAIDMIWIAPGKFTLGSPEIEPGHAIGESPQTEVTLTHGFWLGKTEVTQAQWRAVMGDDRALFPGDDLPVEQVTWVNAINFCKKMTARERAAGRLPEGYAFTLPTEAQWEYACRAGTTTPYSGTLDDVGWYAQNSGYKTKPVAAKKPNAWGLYDMHGNVFEWCVDALPQEYPGGSTTDLVGVIGDKADHVARGGGWVFEAPACRSAVRFRVPFGSRQYFHSVGYRIALTQSALGVSDTSPGAAGPPKPGVSAPAPATPPKPGN